MSIDWKARIKSKQWWIGIISITILIVAYFGIDLTKYIGSDWRTLVGLIFALGGYLGVTVDTSTKGVNDYIAIEEPNISGQAQQIKTEATRTSINGTITENSENK